MAKKQWRGNQPAGKKEQMAQDRLRAMQLRRAGASYRAIGQALNVTYQTAHNYVRTVLEETRQLSEQEAEHYRTLELERCDALQAAAWKKAQEGDVRSISSVLSVMERRARLLGLDKPTTIDAEQVVKVIYADSHPNDPTTAPGAEAGPQ